MISICILLALIYKLFAVEPMDGISNLSMSSLYWVLLSFIFLPINIGLESWKWHRLLGHIDAKPFIECVRIVLLGQSLNVVTPFATGDAYVRIMQSASAERHKCVGAVLMNRATQMIPTLMFGSVSIIFLSRYILGYEYILMVVLVLLAAFVMVFLLIKHASIPFFDPYITLVKQVSLIEIVRLEAISFARYIVFSMQFVLVLFAFEVPLSPDTLIVGVWWVFLIKTILPHMTLLGDLAKREVSAVMFFSVFLGDVSTVVLAGAVVWLINSVIPAVAGLIFISKLTGK